VKIVLLFLLLGLICWFSEFYGAVERRLARERAARS
jgi:hypothetical protein